MKAIGIDAILMNDDCEIVEKQSSMVKALLDNNGEIVFQDVLNLNSLSEIKEYSDLHDFLYLAINTAKNEFDDKFNIFEISGINDSDEYTWNIRCIYEGGNLYYTFKDLSDLHMIFKDSFVGN